jgi:hypothetical protein
MSFLFLQAIFSISKENSPVNSDAFPATEYNEFLLDFQLGQVAETWIKQRFEDHLCPRPHSHISTLGKRTEMVFEKLLFFTVQPLDPTDSPRELHYANLPVTPSVCM